MPYKVKTDYELCLVVKGVKRRDKKQLPGTAERTKVLALPWTGCGALGKFLYLSEPISSPAKLEG